jgi:hypothetical protein
MFHYIADLADAKSSAADYAMSIRKLYDVAVEETGEVEDVREFLLFHISLQHKRGLISKEHHRLALKLLPKLVPSGQGGGRPKGAVGKAAYVKRYKLYRDWIYAKTFHPSLTKEQFAKERLGITDEDLEGDYASDYRPMVDALLQELKPARMKQLDEGERRALEIIYPLVIANSCKNLYREWRAAKETDPALTKEQFVKNHLDIKDEHLKDYPGASNLIRETVDNLERGKELSADSERG